MEPHELTQINTDALKLQPVTISSHYAAQVHFTVRRAGGTWKHVHRFRADCEAVVAMTMQDEKKAECFVFFSTCDLSVSSLLLLSFSFLSSAALLVNALFRMQRDQHF